MMACTLPPPLPRDVLVDGARAPEHDLTCTTGGRATDRPPCNHTHTVMRSRRNGRWQEDGTMVTLRRVHFE
ncbi:hypothetical protein [Plastoroseomonas hellenica]|uniref:hypothetical protein n=1 Tax=Plastoroseomonas hellenica TaxID=2687306 RepID=UPI001BA65FEB|nr:hypothetical protein [Plastoroseomonas hellenica]MBR0643768.1 hypothetical protein [Plastoroseomonas hellenica]